MKIVTAAFAAPLLFTAAAATPALAVDAGNPGTVVAPQTVPDILSGKQKQYYTQILAAIRGQRWDDAKALLADARGGPLDDFLRAELPVQIGRSSCRESGGQYV